MSWSGDLVAATATKFYRRWYGAGKKWGLRIIRVSVVLPNW